MNGIEHKARIHGVCVNNATFWCDRLRTDAHCGDAPAVCESSHNRVTPGKIA